MNKEKLCAVLRSFREANIICYAYRETAFHILLNGTCDNTLHLITDVSANVMTEAMTAKGFKDISRAGDSLDAKLGQQAVKVRLLDGDSDKLSKILCQPLTVCSLLMRDDGDVYDEFGGREDFDNKLLRMTDAPIRDKNAFCTLCFDLTLRKGFVPDDAVRSEMKKMVTLPLTKKIQLMLSVRNYIKGGRFNTEYILNALAYDGLFSAVGEITTEKVDQIDAMLRKTDPSRITLLLCYLSGVKAEHLKSVPGLDFSKESYEKVSRYLKDGAAIEKQALQKDFSAEEVDAILLIAEFTSLLAGKDFTVSEPESSIFRELESSDFWKNTEAPKKDIIPTSKKDSAPLTAQPEEDNGMEPEEMFGGMEEELYEEDDSEPAYIPPINTALGLRNPGDNHYLKK